ncbi:hypothetical protein [Rufibacter sp. LB8]|uniref:hypothetical protein n=1 Tax=Rufibacter sp. LB8 TaxID=2777781 RepID=UPI00178C7A67|nr:hypothetical protein [Rufibacter sp. LB8]
MTVSINVPLRVKHFNAQIKHQDGKVRFSRALGNDRGNPRNYTSILLENALAQNAFLETEEKDARLYQLNQAGVQILLADAQNYLYLLFYLAHERDQKLLQAKQAEKLRIKQEKEKARAARNKPATLTVLHFNHEQYEETAHPPVLEKVVGFELIEEDGVTKLKGTNFVISKFL